MASRAGCHQFADVDQVQLPSLAGDRGVDADLPAIGTESWMRVDSPLAGVDLGQSELAEVIPLFRLDVVKVRGLEPVGALRVGVVENPAISGQVTDVSHRIERAVTDRFDPAVLFVLDQEVVPVGCAQQVAGLDQDVFGVAPDEVRGVSVGDDDSQVAAVGTRGDHSCQSLPIGVTPAVQGDEPAAVGIEQQVIEVMLDARLSVGNVTATGDVGQGDDLGNLSRLQVDADDARIGGSQFVGMRVLQPGVSITGTDVIDSAKIGRDGGAAVGTDRIDRVGHRPSFPGPDVHHVTDETVSLPVVPEHSVA